MTKKIKQEGQYMTPPEIVNIILDSIGYNGIEILDKKIIEPSFGKGVFLEEIVRRIIKVAPITDVKRILEENIFGIEKDINLYNEAIKNLNFIIKENNIETINWKNLINGDTLFLYKNYINQFDYVVGNPPYVRIHNIKQEYRDIVKQFKFTKGTIDLYIVFYELGIQLLNPNGKLGFISPNTFMINKSQKDFRNLLINNKLITKLFNFKYHQIFDNALTYTCICILDKENTKTNLHYKEYKNNGFEIEENFQYSEFNHEVWVLGKKEDVLFLNENRKKEKKLKDITTVQNGISTNADNIYIHSIFEDKDCSIPYMKKNTDNIKIVFFKENGIIYKIENTILRRIVKASKFNGSFSNKYIIYPYKNNSLLSEEVLKTKYRFAYNYLLKNKENLLKRDLEENQDWFAFGRSQGLINIEKEKIIIKRFMDKNSKIIPYVLDSDIIVYACLYFTSDNIQKIIDILSSDDFYRYCCLNGRDMQGEFIGLSSSIIKNFGI